MTYVCGILTMPISLIVDEDDPSEAIIKAQILVNDYNLNLTRLDLPTVNNQSHTVYVLDYDISWERTFKD